MLFSQQIRFSLWEWIRGKKLFYLFSFLTSLRIRMKIKFCNYFPIIALLFPADNGTLMIDLVTARKNMKKWIIYFQWQRPRRFIKIHVKNIAVC